jgi:hypothetical protein
VLERQNSLDQPGDSSGSVQVTYVRFHGSYRTESGSIRRGAKCLCESRYFYGISHHGSRGVSFDVRNLARIDLPSRPMSHGDDLGLPFDAGSGESNFL